MSDDEMTENEPQRPAMPWWSTPPGQPQVGMSLPTTPVRQPVRTPPSKKRPGLGLSSVLVVSLVAGAAGGSIGYVAADRVSIFDSNARLGTTTSVIERAPGSVAGIASRSLPSVTSISVRGGTGSGTGSGFVIREDGYILTNNHVVASAASGGTITVHFQDGSSHRATIVGRSATYDLAVLKISVRGLPALPLGDSDKVVVGDSVIAFGAPLGLAGTVTTGIISAKDRAVTAGESTGESAFINAIQTDAAINPGNSGGPLVDATGAVIGVNSAIATLGSAFGGQTGSIGLGFAIPINQARRTAEQLMRNGAATHPIIGVALDSAYTGTGARIATTNFGDTPPVSPGGPADRAGLEPGDVITALDGKRVNSSDELIVGIRARQPGDVVEIRYERDGRTLTTKVTLAEANS
jgi:putative serine protease PepD